MEQGKDPRKESLERHVLWVAARQNKDGEMVDPRTMDVAQKIVSTYEIQLMLLNIKY